ncbi:efflux RND transporter periplasmic adaptor subunit [Gallalistipes aquisgranensis]|uniref:efflux RND transporter periplasmic adaptor subunit n=1 Tax=Gallalistipes aquisgranensis TaxID=2779358 RepID=UPI001CF8E32F|nr:efflux RND transporter periplasmic adaptor subunit [Gallalistipes aquisgranensis]MBE5033163.1 efflux RND transporter periplasmic adaptor subunit [Gallalistipes aquisgranensis]
MTELRTKIALFSMLLALFGCRSESRQTEMPAPRIEVFRVIRDSIPNRMNFISQTSSNADVAIQPRISGYLLSKHFEQGLPVKKGQLLFRIDPSLLQTEVAQAKASLASAEAQLIEAKNNYNRSIPLARINAISQSQLDQYRAQYASAEASRKAAQSQLRNAQIELSYATIYAPSDGIIGDSDPSVGDYVGAGTKFPVLATISNTDSVSVELTLPVSQYLKITGNSEIAPSYDNARLLSDIVMTLSDGTVYPYKGKYNYTEKNVNTSTGTIVFKVLFPNPDRVLKPGQFAQVAANLGPVHDALLVPQRCVSQSQGINSLWVMAPDSTAEYRKVSLGNTFGTLWEITDGVSDGETVLTSGQLKMRQGMKIIPVPTTPGAVTQKTSAQRADDSPATKTRR